MLGRRRWLASVVVMTLAIVGLGASALADSGSEQGFLSAINSTRSSSGLGPLTMDSGLQSHARRHTADMIAADEIYHSSSAELQAAAGSGWEKLGENVGRGGSVSSLHQAFLDSPGHKANILGDYNYVGIGTDTADNGVLYVTVVFMKKGSSAPAPTTTTSTTAPSETTETTAAAKSTPTTNAPAPQQTTTTTTLPPTTTTTLIVGPDKPVTPGESCYTATRLWWMCHD
jgi:hypothetical protein